MSTSTTIQTKPLARPTSRSNSTRSRKHSAPVQIHALLGTTSTDGTSRGVVKHGQGHRRGASLSASATVPPTPVDRPTVANHHADTGLDSQSTMTPKSRLNPDVSNKTSNNTHFASFSSSPPLQETRQRSHSYASAPLSTLLTRLESPSLASFTLADPHPCAAGSLRRCQWMMEMNASGNWYTSQNGDDVDDESINDNHVQVQQHKRNVDNKTTTLSPTPTKTSSPKQKRMLALPLRLWKKQNISFANHKWDSESDSHADIEDDDDAYCEESDSDGADDTPSLTPHSSRRSSRSRSSAGQSPTTLISSSSSSPPSGLRSKLPSISRKHEHSGFGHVHELSYPPLTERAESGAKPAPSNVAVRHNGDAKVACSTTTTGSSSGKKVSKQDPGTALQEYKEAPTKVTVPIKPSLTVKTQTQNMQTEPISSSLSPLSRTLRSSKNRRINSCISSTPIIPNQTNEAYERIPFPVNPPLSPATTPRSPNSNPTVLLTLSDLERTSKLMRSTTTCAVCGRSGSDFPRCPRTGATWCSRACRIAAKKSASS